MVDSQLCDSNKINALIFRALKLLDCLNDSARLLIQIVEDILQKLYECF